MSKTIGWAAAAVLAATGCGGAATQAVTESTRNEHVGPDERCGVCFVTGGGHITVNGQTFQVDAQTHPDDGPGFGGAGVAASGNLQVHLIPQNTLLLQATVDTILSCTRENGALRSEFSGTIPGGGRFTAVVTDVSEPNRGADSIAVTLTTGQSFGPTALEVGNFQVHDLGACAPPCGEGECLCPDDHLTCEPCHPPPTCLEGYCLNAQTKACELCPGVNIPAPTPPLQP